MLFINFNSTEKGIEKFISPKYFTISLGIKKCVRYFTIRLGIKIYFKINSLCREGMLQEHLYKKIIRYRAFFIF